MRVILGADHGGFRMKEDIKAMLERMGLEVVDVGNSVLDTDDDYVDFAVKVAQKVVADSGARGILFCRNGIGMSITANRFVGVRCGLVFNEETTKKGRTDDDINILSLPADYISNEEAEKMVRVFIETEFDGRERYQRRINKLDEVK